MKKTLLTFFISILISTSAQAAIIDSGNFFIDDNTGYTWMDLSTYKSFSYNDVNNIIQDAEFQIATLSLLQELWESTYQYKFSYLHDVMGGTFGSSMLISMYDSEREDNLAGLAWTWNYNEKILWDLETNYHSYDSYYDTNATEKYNVFKDKKYTWGTWVVKTSIDSIDPNFNTAPEPSTLLLFGAGLLGLAAFRRARQYK